MPHRKEQSITSTEKTTIPRLVLIIGGARSGKSSFAEQLAASSERPVAFIATATAGDDEMRERIARHRASRRRQWHTLEEPLDLSGAARRASELADVLLLDCVTLWLGNVLSQASKQHESGMYCRKHLSSMNRHQSIPPTPLRWHLSVSPTLLRSYPPGQVRRKES